ncbi:MAG TPA: hypothetical protein VHA73_13405 [Acidimicrobiales bacterium]|jgi:hypothetical protein|nr:hypothetical protein [Acidimicrobiales bacterium]
MTPTAAAEATRDAVVAMPSHFMLDAATYAHGTELGFEGANYYVAGRGAVLGPCDADVVAAAFVFFNPGHIRAAWDASVDVMSSEKAAIEWAKSCETWAEAHLPDGPDYARLAELTAKIVTTANPASSPIFGGWRHLEVPDAPKAATLHHLNALRELRLSLHGGAVLAAGLLPVEALAVNSPHMAALFGWAELPDVRALGDAWAGAEDATNRAMGRVLGGLDEAELGEFVERCAEVVAAHASAT